MEAEERQHHLTGTSQHLKEHSVPSTNLMAVLELTVGPYSNSVRWMLLSSLVYIRETWDSGQLNNLHKVLHVRSGKGTQTDNSGAIQHSSAISPLLATCSLPMPLN